VISLCRFNAYGPGMILIRPLLTALLLLAAAAPLHSQTVEEIVQARIIPGTVDAAGNRVAAIRLTLLPGWKTYWRAPGEAGIPPSFDWAGSGYLAEVALVWPRPEVFDLNGMTTIGYHEELVLPIVLTPAQHSQPLDLRLRMEIGVCKDICVPAVLTLRANLDDSIAAQTEVADPAIARALATRPLTGGEAGVADVACTVTPIADGLSVRAEIYLPSQGGAELVVFEAEDPKIWISPAATSRSGAVLRASADLVPPAGAPFALDRSTLTLTVLGRDGAVEIRGCPAP
jgi:DsbC/DsbD-like thiol-disulfide interchange protein